MGRVRYFSTTTLIKSGIPSKSWRFGIRAEALHPRSRRDEYEPRIRLPSQEAMKTMCSRTAGPYTEEGAHCQCVQLVSHRGCMKLAPRRLEPADQAPDVEVIAGDRFTPESLTESLGNDAERRARLRGGIRKLSRRRVIQEVGSRDKRPPDTQTRLRRSRRARPERFICSGCTVVTTGTSGCPSSRSMAYSRSP